MGIYPDKDFKFELINTYGPNVHGGWETIVRWYKFEPGVNMTDEQFLQFCKNQGLVTTQRGEDGCTESYCTIDCSDVYGPGYPEDTTTHQEWAHRQYVKVDVGLKFEIVHRGSKDIHYGDGYRLAHYRFDHPITEDEFWTFCEKMGEETRRKDAAAWFESYGEVKQIDDLTWEHKEVLRYTD